MAGVGFDALMIRDADAGLKDRIGRAAYLYTGAKNLSASPVRATVEVEGRRFYKGVITCVLVGDKRGSGASIAMTTSSRFRAAHRRSMTHRRPRRLPAA